MTDILTAGLNVLSTVATVAILESILSLDNTAVLASMAVHLPKIGVPWPTRNPSIAVKLDQFFGNQQQASLRVGMWGAFLFRALAIFVASAIVGLTIVKVVGALYLFNLVRQYFTQREVAEEEKEEKSGKYRSFWQAVVAIEAADLIFSLDNVVVAVGVSAQFWLVITGVVVGILAMRLAAGWMVKLVEFEPRLETAAYLVIAFIGIKILISVVWGIEVSPMVQLPISLLIFAGCFSYGRIKHRSMS